jgi:hypothetical protein
VRRGGERERERECVREGERERGRNTQTDRQTHRQTDTYRGSCYGTHLLCSLEHLGRGHDRRHLTSASTHSHGATPTVGGVGTGVAAVVPRCCVPLRAKRLVVRCITEQAI